MNKYNLLIWVSIQTVIKLRNQLAVKSNVLFLIHDLYIGRDVVYLNIKHYYIFTVINYFSFENNNS